MTTKKLLLITLLPGFLVGCAGFYDKQPPAPVFGDKPAEQKAVQTNPLPTPAQPVEPPPTVETTPLKDYEIKDEPLQELPSAPIEAPLSPIPPGNSQQEPLAPDEADQSAAQQQPEATVPQNKPAPSPTRPAIVVEAPKPVVEKHTTLPFEPFESSVASSPAVGALLADATQNSKSGSLDQAVTTIERAIRIEPRNANLYYKLAVIRLKQSKPRLAEDL
ncbi:MAG: tetratricopeptide repeat protein, partial [Methylococcales bacterium]